MTDFTEILFPNPKKTRKHLKNCQECRNLLENQFKSLIERIVTDSECREVIGKINAHSEAFDK